MVDTTRAGERSGAALRVDHTDLSDRGAGIDGARRVECLLGGAPLIELFETAPPVRGFRERLGRDRADARLRPRHDRSDREHARLHTDAELARDRIASDDRVRHVEARRAASCCEKNSNAVFVFVACSPATSIPLPFRYATVSAATWKVSLGAHLVESSRMRVLSG